MTTLNIGGLIPESVVDGPGIRFALFAQGCKHDCPQCFNNELQEFRQTRLLTIDEILNQIQQYQSKGVTFSGGDPFEQAEGFAELAKHCRKRGLSIWCYTGYTYEHLLTDPPKLELLKELDVLVDGPFVLAKKDISLHLRGSSNQRLIDVQASLNNGTIILYHEKSI